MVYNYGFHRSITITSCCGTGSPEVHRKGHRAIGAAPRGAAAALPAAQERHLRCARHPSMQRRSHHGELETCWFHAGKIWETIGKMRILDSFFMRTHLNMLETYGG